MLHHRTTAHYIALLQLSPAPVRKKSKFLLCTRDSNGPLPEELRNVAYDGVLRCRYGKDLLGHHVVEQV